MPDPIPRGPFDQGLFLTHFNKGREAFEARRFERLSARLKLRDRVSTFLSRNHVCVISTNGSHGAWASVATYDNQGLLLSCHLPRWSEAAFFLEQDPEVLAIILDGSSEQLRWLLTQLDWVEEEVQRLDRDAGEVRADHEAREVLVPGRLQIAPGEEVQLFGP